MSATRQQTTEARRVVVFVDEANVYNDARRAFFKHDSGGHCGRIKPYRFGELLARKEPLGTSEDRELAEVRVYTGTPAQERDAAAYAAHRRQVAAWQAGGATVLTRSLRYPRGWPKSGPAQQKGVDVQIAIDMITMALRGQLDVAILASTDTDLIPAIESFHFDPLKDKVTVEVAAWRCAGYVQRLNLPKSHLWCHYLDEDDYKRVADRTAYSTPPPK
jgi:uncharacterized LabA/DUF88 family protein